MPSSTAADSTSAPSLKILFIGDIVGKPGRRALDLYLHRVQEEFGVDLTIANGENAAGGFGITPPLADELFEMGIDVITTGNHIWDKREIIPFVPKENCLLRPLNYPPGTPGYGSVVVSAGEGTRVAVINVVGRVFMPPYDCPFRAVDSELERLGSEAAVRVVDIHAEATSEKQAMGWFLDGRVSAVVGTHTHVQTADERLLPGGTAYITDVGMTGPSDSVIGVKSDIIVRRFLASMPERFETAKNFPQFAGVVLEVDPARGSALSITRVQHLEAAPDPQAG